MGATRLATAFVEVVGRGFDSVGNEADKLKGRLGSAFSSIANTMLGVAGGQIMAQMASAMAQFGVSSIKAAAEAEMTAAAFETMLGSASKAEKMLGDLRSFAAATPFEMTGLTSAAKTLMQFGIESQDVLPTLKMLGDVASGDEQKLASVSVVFGQIASTGRLMGGDLLQLINVGFNPLQEISQKTGESMASLKNKMEAGQIPFSMVKQAFIDATGEGGRFFGMTEKMAKTVGGLWSTFMDSIGSVQRALGKFIIEGFNVREILKNLAGTMEAFGAQVEALGATLMPLLQRMLQLAPVIARVATDALAGAAALYTLKLAFIGAAMGAKGFANGLKVALVSTGWGVLVLILGEVVRWIYEAVRAAIAMKPAQEAMSGAIQKFAMAFEVLREAGEAAMDALAHAVREVAGPILEWFGVKVGDLPGSIGEAFKAAIDWIADFALNAAEWFRVIAENSGTVWELIKNSIALKMSEAWDAVTGVWNQAVSWFTSIGEGITWAVTTAFDEVYYAIQTIWNKITMFVQLQIEGIKAMFAGLGSAIGSAFEDFNRKGGMERFKSANPLRLASATKDFSQGLMNIANPFTQGSQKAIRTGAAMTMAEMSKDSARLGGEYAAKQAAIEEARAAARAKNAERMNRLGFRDVNTPESGATKILREETARLAGTLGAAKLQAESERQARLNRMAPVKAKAPVVPEEEEKAKAKDDKKPQPVILKDGFSSFADLNKKVQEAFMNKTDPQEKLVDLGEEGNKLLQQVVTSNEKIATAVEKNVVPTAN